MEFQEALSFYRNVALFAAILIFRCPSLTRRSQRRIFHWKDRGREKNREKEFLGVEECRKANRWEVRLLLLSNEKIL